MLRSFRFTIRDVLWWMAVAALACMWWMEWSKSSRLSRERDEAIARWRHASQNWVEATRLIPPQRNSGRIGGGGGMGAGGMGARGLGGRAPAPLSPAADEAVGDDGKKKSRK